MLEELREQVHLPEDTPFGLPLQDLIIEIGMQEQRLEQDKALASSATAAKAENDKHKQFCGCCSIM